MRSMSATRHSGIAVGRFQIGTRPGDLPELARALVGRLVVGGLDPSLHDVDGETQEFLYDGEVDGLRLIVIRPRPTPARPTLLLSPRECEIARMVAKGYPNKTIAA